MKFSCTPESSASGELTVLAILETVVAIVLSLLLISFLHSAAPIVVGAIIAPFLLLRTDASTTRAFAIFDSGFSKLIRFASFFERFYASLPDAKVLALRSFSFTFVWLPLCGVLAVVAKIFATLLTLISSPRETLLAIPKNWVRIALATDCRHPPEFLPGSESAADAPASVQTFRWAEIRDEILARTSRPLLQRFTIFAVRAPAILYRLFLKSSSLIYFPLIWVSDVPLTAKGILTYPLERVRRWYAFAILVVMLSPMVISFPPVDKLPTARDRAIITYMLPVHKGDWWHLSRVLAVGITIAVYFYARTLREDSVQPQRERLIIIGANRLRAACAIFILACFLTIVLTL